jgi:hypothetical protein
MQMDVAKIFANQGEHAKQPAYLPQIKIAFSFNSFST